MTLGTPIIVGGILLVVMPRRGGGQTPQMEVRKLGYLLAIGGSMAFVSRDAISRHVLGALALAPPFVVSGFALVIGGAILFAFIHRSVINSVRNLPMKYVWICCLAGLLQGLAVASLFHALSRAPGHHRNAHLRQPAHYRPGPGVGVPAPARVAGLAAGRGYGDERCGGCVGNPGRDDVD